MAFDWRAPDACPDADEVRRRIERRLGMPLDGSVHGIAVEISAVGLGFVARIDTRSVTVANEARTLTSAHCDALADAVAVVVARLASDARLELRRSPNVAAIEIAAERPPQQSRWPWGGGLRALALSGIGSVPRVGIGGELGGFVRRRAAFGELAIARWVTSPKYLVDGAPGGVEVDLQTVVVRGGWSPEHMPLRAWLGGELGRIRGAGVGLVGARTGDGAWYTVQAGFGVAWPMSRHASLVGTFEIGAPLSRPRFILAEGGEVFQPSPLIARCAFGLEVGWR